MLNRFHYVMIVFVFLEITLKIQCDEVPTDFIISDELKTEQFESLTRTYRVPIVAEEKKEFILVKVFPSDSSNPTFVFISKKMNEVTNDKSAYKSFEYNPFVFIPSNYYSTETTELFVKVTCQKDCNYQIGISYRKTYQLEDNSSFEFQVNPYVAQDVIYDPKTGGKDFQITIQSGEEGGSMEVVYKEQIKSQGINMFKNGHAVIVGADEYIYDNEKFFVISFKGTKKTLYTISHRLLPISKVAIREKVNIVLDGVKQIKSCFTLNKINTSNAGTAYILNALSYTRNAYVFIASVNGKEVKGTFIDSTGYLRFNANDFEDKITICVKPMDGYSKTVGLQFQIFNEFELLQSQGFNAPLLRGNPIKGYLPKGEIMFYRVNTLPNQQSVKMYLNYHMNKGDPLFYYAIINNFPYIAITAEEIKKMGYNIATIHDINDHFYFFDSNILDNPHMNPRQIGGIVHCPDTSIEGCEFDLTIGITSEITDLIKDMKMYQPKDTSETHIYQFEITDPSISSLKVYLYSFSGDGELTVSKNQYFIQEAGKFYAAGNREYYECINTAEPGNLNTLLGKFYVQVKSNKAPIYYSIYYSTYTSGSITNIDVPSGEVVTETINQKEKTKRFTFANRLTTNNVNYFASIIALNCDISIMFAEEKYTARTNTFIIKPSDAVYQSGRYSFEITLDMIDTQSQDKEENCLIYLSGDEMVNDKEMLLNEGISHSTILSKDIKRIVYLFPLLYLNVYSNYETVAININKMDEGKLKLSYSINDDKMVESFIIINPNRKISINRDHLSAKCFFTNETRLCPIIITVELVDDPIQDESIEFTIGVASRNEIPFYLPKGFVRQDLLGFKENQYNYYYCDIKNMESGEIVINFKRGSGLMVARIVSKSTVDEFPNWNKRIRLPKSSYQDSLPFDYFNKKIVFNEKHTKDCLASGCELYIGVYVYEKLSYIAEYSLFIRNDDTIVSLPENNLVFGSLSKLYTDSKEEEEVDYFTTHIHTDTDRILLNLIGELCFGYAKLGKDKPNKQNANWKFEGKNTMFEIKASDTQIASTSMIGKDITFAIGTKGLENIYSSFYSFKVISPLKNIPTIIEVSSSYNEMCDINSKNGQCYFVIPIDRTAQLSRICMTVLSEKIANSQFEIYSRYIKTSDYEELSVEEKFSLFPTDVSHDKSSASAFNTNYLCVILEYLQWSVDSYLLITVKAKEPGRITFLASYYNPPFQIYVKPNSKEMLIINEPKNLIVYGKDNYYIEIVRLENSALVSTFTEKKLIINKEQKNLAIILNSDGEKSIYIQPENSSKQFYCYIQYSIRPLENFDEVKYGRYNYITYLTPSFPMIYYIPVENEEDNVLVNVRFSVYEYEEGNSLGDDDFIVQGLVTDEDFIIKRKKDSTIEPEVTSSITDLFNQGLRLGRLTFRSIMIKEHIANSKKYLYVSIKPKDTNKHKYTHLSAQVIAMPDNSLDRQIILPSNQYFFTQIDHSIPTKLIFFKNDLNDEVMEIEFSLLDSLFTFTVNPIPDDDNNPIDYTKNGTDFISQKTVNGRNFLLIHVSNNKKGLAFIVFKQIKLIRSLINENKIGNEFFAVKYQSDANIPKHYAIKKDKLSWESTSDKSIFTIIFESISDQEGNTPLTNYYVNYYAETNETELTSFYLKQEPIAFDKIEKSTESKLTISSENSPKGNFYFTVTAVSKIGNTEEILVYTPNCNIIKKPDDNSNNTGYVFYIIGGVAVVLILIGILVYFYLKYRKADNKIKKTDYKKIEEAGPVLTEEHN